MQKITNAAALDALLILCGNARAGDTQQGDCQFTYDDKVKQEIMLPALKRDTGKHYVDYDIDDPHIVRQGKKAIIILHISKDFAQRAQFSPPQYRGYVIALDVCR